MNTLSRTLVSSIALGALLTPAGNANDSETKTTLEPIVLAAKKDDQANPIVKWGAAPTFKSSDGRFTFKPRGRLYFDYGSVHDTNNSLNLSATETRTGRMGVEGQAWDNIKYKFEVDFAGSGSEVKDAYIQYVADGYKVSVGQHKTPNSLDEQTSSRYTTLMERGSFTDAFGLARRIGVSIGTGGDNWTATAGIFKGDNSTSAENEGMEFAARVTYGMKTGDTQFHFGASTRYRKAGFDQSAFRYRQRPHNHLSDRFINTDRLGKEDTMFAFEFAAINGPLSLQSEYATLTSDMNVSGVNNPTFRGGYIDLSYFVSGGKRSYSASKGTFGRNKVTSDSGAMQITARYDLMDLSDAGVAGGAQKTAIVGVNYYLNPYMRIMANYSHAKITGATNVGANDLLGNNKVNAFGLRAQVDW